MINKIVLFVLAMLFAAQNSLFAAEPLQNRNPELAANFTLLDLKNKECSLSDFKGKPLVLFFWTTWCPYCRKELKQLNSMHAELLNNKMEVLAINVEEPADKVQRVSGIQSFSYRVLLDTDGKVAEAYGILGIPTYFLIDKEGRIVFMNHYFPQEEYKKKHLLYRLRVQVLLVVEPLDGGQRTVDDGQIRNTCVKRA